MRSARSTSFCSARWHSRASVGCAIAFGCTVVSTTTRSRSRVEGAGLVRHRQALLEQSHQLLFAQPLAPMRQRGAIERQLVTEAQFTTEELIIGVFNPARAQHLVR